MFDKTETLRLTVGGMSCGHCVKRVEDALRAVKGVKSVKVTLEDGAAQIAYVPAKVSAAALVAAVEAAGYTARKE